MNKDAYYFPHFCNARHDRKIKRIVKELGVEGYGIFFMTLEVLREQTDLKFPLDDIDLLADEFGTSEAKLKTVICNYQLFDIDKQERFFSPKLLLYLQPYFQRSEKARNAALKRWNKDNDAQAMLEHSTSNASKVKYSKVKESIYRSFDHLSITDKEFKKLSTNYQKKDIDSILDRIQNYSQNKKYNSLYLTALNWIKKDKEIKPLNPDKEDNYQREFKATDPNKVFNMNPNWKPEK